MTEENKNLTIIDDWEVPSKEERETILSFEDESQSWHIYTDVPKHARKYEKFIDQSKPHRKGYSVNGGKLAMIEGYFKDNVYISVAQSTPRQYTTEQRERARERMKELRTKNKL
ncbi:hypothetical protein AALT52_05860 [Ligilactobacillus faecis]|uniref:Uncharacterized protein n=1 Tax=Ligilactobacillus faecis TaxID=762833 RepID=A0ABV4DPL3_9LACO